MSNSTLTLKPDHRVYLDHNATAPLASFLKPKIAEWLEHWGNPSSIHWAGREPKALMRDARRQLAHLLKVEPLELIFTGGGSEANNLAIKGVFDAIQGAKIKSLGSREHYLLSAVEHPSVSKTMRYLESRGAKVDVIKVNRDGSIDLEHYASLLSERTALVSVMFANNETGSIFPVAKMAKMAHKAGALFHCDGVQALGKATLDLKTWGIDLASFSAHKFYALKGVGVLYARAGLNLESLIHGGGQERGRRAGTENILGIASFGAVAETFGELGESIERMARLRDELENQVCARIEGVSVTGKTSPRIANTSSMVISGVDGETLLMNLDMRGFSVSTGAACSAGSPEPSPVLMAMGLTREEAQSSLRVSLGWGTTAEEIALFVETLEQVVARLRSFRHGEKAMYGV